jgi:DNA modification methylase
LSFCTGWGAEIAGVIAYGEHTLFTAIDANSSLADGWRKMVETLDPEGSTDPRRYDLRSGMAVEDADLGDNMYDFIMSSPPYFHGEAYSKDPTQGYLRYGTVEAWIEGFLRPALVKSWQHLRPGGVIALMINDTWTVNPEGERELVRIVEPTHSIMDGFADSVYIDTWAFKTNEWRRSYQPLFVWRKREDN